MREEFVTPSGATVRVVMIDSGKIPNRKALRYDFTISTTSDSTQAINVIFPAPTLIDRCLQDHGLPSLAEMIERVAYMAVICAVDHQPEIFEAATAVPEIKVDCDSIVALLRPNRLDDRSLRRYLARRIYNEFTRGTLNHQLELDEFDTLTTGATSTDFLRNAELLAEEEYLAIQRYYGGQFLVRPQAQLIREVERYGAAREDVISQQDYMAALVQYPALEPQIEAIGMEYRRYSTASTPAELMSVFRAIAPIVEDVLRSTLRTSGSTGAFSALGPMLQELKNRGLGDLALLSQLNHVLRFSRDLSLHGHQIPEAVLRIACVNAFELVPQLAAL